MVRIIPLLLPLAYPMLCLDPSLVEAGEDGEERIEADHRR